MLRYKKCRFLHIDTLSFICYTINVIGDKKTVTKNVKVHPEKDVFF